MPRPILYNRLGSAADIQASVVGENGTPSAGITYGACKFGNGFLADADYENVSFSDTDINNVKGIIDFWYKPNFNFGADNPVLFADRVGANYIQLYVNFGTALLFYVYGTGGSALATDSGTTWTAGDLIHFLFVWDNDEGFDATKTIAMYVDGAETASSTTNFGTINKNGTLVVGNGADAAGAPNTNEANGYMDNLKIYDGVGNLSLILANRERERFGLNDVIT